MQVLSQKSRFLKSFSGLLIVISCYATVVSMGAALLVLLGFSMAYSFLDPAIPFIDLIREPLFFVALALFILVSLWQGIPAFILAVVGGLLLYIGYYVYPNNLPLLVGGIALIASYLVGRKHNSLVNDNKSQKTI